MRIKIRNYANVTATDDVNDLKCSFSGDVTKTDEKIKERLMLKDAYYDTRW